VILIIVIVVACVVGGCGKGVEGVSSATKADGGKGKCSKCKFTENGECSWNAFNNCYAAGKDRKEYWDLTDAEAGIIRKQCAKQCYPRYLPWT
jgi:hypothetical protein